jgi:hypothetical protein
VKGIAMAHLKMGSLKQTIWQVPSAKVRRRCHKTSACRQDLEKVVAIGGSCSDYFSSNCHCASFKTVFMALNDEIYKLVSIFVKKMFYCPELLHALYSM